jgi:hypothetical protein
MRNPMLKRRSKSQRPPKARTSEAPPQEAPVAANAIVPAEELSPEGVTPPAIDELAALDAGWDNLPS